MDGTKGNTPRSEAWPSPQVWQKELGDEVSVLHGPFATASFAKLCHGSDPFATGQSPICLQVFACQYEFCDDQTKETSNLPAYIVESQSVSDIQKALQFARTHSIPVSIKATGHSYHGASTLANSLGIWMRNFPKDGGITQNFVDSCRANRGDVIGIGGGENWDDVLASVKGKYHIVTGDCRTVSAAGGWLQGVGLSFTSRRFGLGIDNVVEFDLVLPNGTDVKADACTNPDLFWALRGGGGGTFGVVTHVQYRVHPVAPITSLEWRLQSTLNGAQGPTVQQVIDFGKAWLEYWIQVSPFLDYRWGGTWSANGASLQFVGTMEEAEESFLNNLTAWFDIQMASDAFRLQANNVTIASPKASLIEYSSWFEFKGGAAAIQNPRMTDKTGDTRVKNIAARLVSRDTVIQKPQQTLEMLLDVSQTGNLAYMNYLLGGVMMDVPDDYTAVHPAMRRALWSINTFGEEAANQVRSFVPNHPLYGAASFNHHSPKEPDWLIALWGKTHYDRLLDLKNAYDPHQTLKCWHCVGYVDASSIMTEEEFRRLKSIFVFASLVLLTTILWLFRRSDLKSSRCFEMLQQRDLRRLLSPKRCSNLFILRATVLWCIIMIFSFNLYIQIYTDIVPGTTVALDFLIEQSVNQTGPSLLDWNPPNDEISFHIVNYGSNPDIDCGGCVVLYTLKKMIESHGSNVTTGKFKECPADPSRPNQVIIYPEVHDKRCPNDDALHLHWMLAPKGMHFAGVDGWWHPDDLIFHYCTNDKNTTKVPIPITNVLMFARNPYTGDDTDPSVTPVDVFNRSGMAVMVRKGLHFHADIADLLKNETARLSPNNMNISKTVDFHESMDLRQFKYFFSYDPYSFWSFKAAMLGSVSIIYPLSGRTKEDWIRSKYVGTYLIANNLPLEIPGIAYGSEPDEIEYARNTMHKLRPLLLDVNEWGRKETVMRMIRDSHKWLQGKRDGFEGGVLARDFYYLNSTAEQLSQS